ncbi:MAG: aminopeptidase P N-terminal domain-containing protein [Prosthecobacter sp.]|jgi:Xaa-Pro aminopeptidase|nr:aminopeptidase P N-terminal domain-containing protein [Prosthecobacter sp.]
MRYRPLPAEFHQSNRQRLYHLLPPGSLVVLTANDVLPTNADGTMGFVQNSDLFYLSGIDQEETLLLLFPDAPDPKQREMLFVRETNEHIAIWEGQKLTQEEARERSGIQRVHWLQDFETHFRQLMCQCSQVYLNSNEHPRAVIQTESREMRLALRVRREYPLHDVRRLAPLMHELRRVKQPAELGALSEAIRITEDGFRRLLRFVKPGVYEFEVEAELAHEFIRQRARGFAYLPIIASGANGCVLHYNTNHCECRDGEMLLLDVAACYGNYNADLTRTIPVNGRYTQRQRQVYEAVLRVMRECNQMLRPGVILREYQEEVGKLMTSELIGLGLLDRDAVEKQDPEKPLFKKYFPHGTSHHLGIDVHDVGQTWLPVQEGMVFTIEPGIYIREEGLAVRLENNYLIGADRNTDLMASIPIEVEEIEELMNAAH